MISDGEQKAKGFLRTCMDRRFIMATRKAFEEATGLGETDYWQEAYAGGSALAPANTIGEDYALAHGATIFGWQAHGDHCGGQPGVENEEIQARLDAVIAEKIKKFPQARHFRLYATEQGVEVVEIKV